jgi:membrane protein YdbS with pleckstrin-like domain
MPTLARLEDQVVTGVVPPTEKEAMIRDVWASVTASPAIPGLAKTLIRSIVLAPLGWLLLAPLFFKKVLGILPFARGLAVRYTLTNRRLMIRHGLKPVIVQEIPLTRIKDARLVPGSFDQYYLTGTLEVIDADGKVALTLPGVGEPESLRQTILQAVSAFGKAAN